MKEKRKLRIFGRLQRTPKEKWKKEEFSELEYEPTPVKMSIVLVLYSSTKILKFHNKYRES